MEQPTVMQVQNALRILAQAFQVLPEKERKVEFVGNDIILVGFNNWGRTQDIALEIGRNPNEENITRRVG